MKIKNIIIILTGLVLFVAYSVLMVFLGKTLNPDISESHEQIPKESVIQKPDFSLTVKEIDGKIYVYGENPDIPQKVLDIKVENLRRYDRERFQKGIKLKSIDELMKLEEDFSN